MQALNLSMSIADFLSTIHLTFCRYFKIYIDVRHGEKGKSGMKYHSYRKKIGCTVLHQIIIENEVIAEIIKLLA